MKSLSNRRCKENPGLTGRDDEHRRSLLKSIDDSNPFPSSHANRARTRIVRRIGGYDHPVSLVVTQFEIDTFIWSPISQGVSNGRFAGYERTFWKLNRSGPKIGFELP